MIGVVSRVGRVLGRAELEAPVPLPEEVVALESRLVPRVAGLLSGMNGPAAAVTLGRTILVAPGVPLTTRLARHELAHVRQWEREGPAFPFRYIRAHIRHGYRGNPYEAEARAAESGRRTMGEEA